MRILLDENVPRRLAAYISTDHAVVTVQARGWAGKKNGDLIRLAQDEFDVFITMDQGVEYQQNVPQFQIAVITLNTKTNRLSDVVPLVPELFR